MHDLEKENFCFDILNQLHDEYGRSDPEGILATQIQISKGKELDNILRYLRKELLIAMEEKAVRETNKAAVAALRIIKNSRYGR